MYEFDSICVIAYATKWMVECRILKQDHKFWIQPSDLSDQAGFSRKIG